MSKLTDFLSKAKAIGEAGSSFIPIIKFVLSISGVLGLVMFTNAHFEQKRLIEQYAYDVEQYETRVLTANNFADSLKTEIAMQEELAEAALEKTAQLSSQVSSLRAERITMAVRLDSLKEESVVQDTAATQIIELQDSIIEHQDSIIDTQSEQITELSSVIERKDLSIYFLTESVDSLQSVIDTRPVLPEDPEKLLGLIPAPSRTMTAVGALTVGIVATLMLAGK